MTTSGTGPKLTVQPGGHFSATHGVGKRVAPSLALNTPYSYHTNWWPGTWEGRAVVQESPLNIYFVQPPVAFRLNERFGPGVDFIYAYGRWALPTAPTSCCSPSTSPSPAGATSIR